MSRLAQLAIAWGLPLALVAAALTVSPLAALPLAAFALLTLTLLAVPTQSLPALSTPTAVDATLRALAERGFVRGSARKFAGRVVVPFSDARGTCGIVIDSAANVGSAQGVVVDFFSRSTDARSLTTTNSPSRTTFAFPPGAFAQRARGAGVDALLALHRDGLAALATTGFAPRPIPVDDVADVVESFMRALRSWHAPTLWLGPLLALVGVARRYDVKLVEQPAVRAVLGQARGASVLGIHAPVAALSTSSAPRRR